MAFKGFDLELPTYDVVVPQTRYVFSVRSLLVHEEEALRGSYVHSTKLNEKLNEIIWHAIVSKPDGINNIKDFIKCITYRDREALLYGLYHISYGEVRDYDITCSVCGKMYPLNIEASDTFNINPYPMGKEDGPGKILEKKVKVQLPVSKVTAFIRQPSLEDETLLAKEVGEDDINGESKADCLKVEKFLYVPKDAKNNKEVTDREDIVDAWTSLPVKDRKAINKAFKENFGQYEIELKTKGICPRPDCGNGDEVIIDLTAQFFRMVYGD